MNPSRTSHCGDSEWSHKIVSYPKGTKQAQLQTDKLLNKTQLQLPAINYLER